MHMPDLSDDELDALFRQGAEHYPEELNLGAWARMEQKLDEAHVQKLVNRKVARWFAAEVGIVAVLLLLWGSYREYADTPGGRAAHAPTATTTPNQPNVRRRAVAAGAAEVAVAARPEAARQTPAARLAKGAVPSAEPTTTAESAETAAPPSGATASTARPKRLRNGGLTTLTPANDHSAEHQPAANEVANAAATDLGTEAKARRRRPVDNQALLAAGSTHRARPQAATAAMGAADAASSSAATVQAAQAGRESERPGKRRRSYNAAPTTVAALAAAGKVGKRSAGVTQPGAEDAASATARPSATAPGSASTTSSPLNGLAGTSRTANGRPMTSQATDEAASAPAASAASGAPTTAAAAGTTTVPTTAEAAPADELLLPVSAALLTDSIAGLPALLPADSVVRRRPRPFGPSRLFVTGLYSPELSTVRNAGFERPGHSVGIQVEYLIRPRLRLSVGLLSSVKYYRARGADYTWAWTPSYTVDRIDATCRITDIPVNLRYDAWQGVRYRAFVSAGLSSLLMRDEVYKYGYTYYGNYYTRSWQIKNGRNHPFSVVNLSAGLERQLSLRWAVQAEPYLKLPLGGVGQGKVRLSSGGVFFGLKYGL